MSGWPIRGASESTKDGIQWQSGDDYSETSSQFSTQIHEKSGSSQTRTPDIGCRLRTLYKSEKFADVKFTVKTSKKMKSSLSAHKAILAVGSTQFEEMLYGPSTRELPHDAILEIEINNISFDAFRNIVEYLYTDEVYFESDSLVLETMITAKKFEIQSLADRCESFFDARELTVDNVCSLLQLSLSNKMEPLKNRCLQFVQENTSDVLRSSAFFESSITTIRTIFKCQQLNLRSEGELFEVAVKWSQKAGAANLRNHMESLLKSIRFLSLPANEFGSLMQRFPNILSREETLDIMMYITNPPKGKKTMNLPTWCNKEVKSRCTPSVSGLSIRDKNETCAIPLKTFPANQNLKFLKSFLEMRCTRGRHQINSIKLLFQDSAEQRRIGHLTLRIQVFPSGFKHEEHLRIENSPLAVVNLTKRTLAQAGDVVRIEADAQEVENYRFLQFDPSKQRVGNSSFECTVSSLPKWEKLYCISEIYFTPQKPPAHKGRRR